MEQFQSFEDIKKHIIEGINDCVDYLIGFAADYDSELMQVKKASEEELPKLVNVNSYAAQALLQARLEGSNYPKDMDPFLEVLFDVGMNVDQNREIGANDGALQTFSTMADRLGMTEESKRATSAVYCWD